MTLETGPFERHEAAEEVEPANGRLRSTEEAVWWRVGRAIKWDFSKNRVNAVVKYFKKNGIKGKGGAIVANRREETKTKRSTADVGACQEMGVGFRSTAGRT